MTPTGETLFDYVDRSRYPVAPGFKKDRDTSFAAARAIERRAPILRKRILDLLDKGYVLTPDECADILKIDKLAVRPRFSELAALGKIEDSGQRHKNASGKQAIAWRLAA